MLPDPEKSARVRALLDHAGLAALVLRRPGNVAWAGEGGRTHIEITPEVGVASVVLTRAGATVVTAVNEVERLRAEEITGPSWGWEVVGWDADSAAATLAVAARDGAGGTVGSDGPLPGTRDVGADVEAARRALVPADVERYRALGADAAVALTAACAALEPVDTEHECAAKVARRLVRRGIDPIVLLVAGAQRLPAHRHPLPTSAPLGPLVMVVVCARRDGLVANLTRYVAFGAPSADVRERYGRLLQVEAAYLDALRPGTPVRDVLAAGRQAYAEHGFPADESRRHHQGGPCGFASRDHLATDACDEAVEAEQAFAWNPSAPEVKVEDTVLVRGGTRGIEVLTVDPAWPTLDVGGRARPDLWVR